MYKICHMTLLLLLSHFSHIQLCATPWTAAHQALLSLGFSRQEHWSGLPFPSPRHESEKWKRSHLVMSNSQRPQWLQPTRLLCPWDFPGKSAGVDCHCLLHVTLLALWIIFYFVLVTLGKSSGPRGSDLPPEVFLYFLYWIERFGSSFP